MQHIPPPQKTADIGGKPISLNDGEVIVWQGRPVQGILRNPTHIVWGLALIALGLWLDIGNAGVRLFLGLPFVLIGGYLAYFHAIVEKNRRAATYYALSNQRAILAYSLRVLAYPISPKSHIKLKKGRFDTVLFAMDTHVNTSHSARLNGFGFGHLEDGDELYSLIRGLQNKPTQNL